LLLAANQQEKVLSDLKSLERELKDQGGRLAERETLIASLQQSLAGKQGEVERSAVQNHTLSMDLAQARRELTESRSAREILERKCEAQDQRIRELAASLESAQQDAINGRAQAEASARAVERLQGELQKEAVTIQQLIRAVVTSQAALDRLQRTWVGRLARRFGR
jgi:chromosome segregation ATPase